MDNFERLQRGQRAPGALWMATEGMSGVNWMESECSISKGSVGGVGGRMKGGGGRLAGR
jgi:hypothetical protein